MKAIGMKSTWPKLHEWKVRMNFYEQKLYEWKVYEWKVYEWKVCEWEV